MNSPDDNPASTPGAGSAPRTPRAGRDLPRAIGVALGVGAIAIALLIYARPCFVALIAIIAAAAVWEMRATLRQARGINLVWVPVLVGTVATIAASWWWGSTAQIVGIVLTSLAILFVRLARGAEGYLIDSATSIFLAVYLGGFGSFATLLVQPADGFGRMLVFLIAVVSSDTGGYAVGVLFGRHPMAPRISPKKSWEGLAGSLVTATVASAIAAPLLLDAVWWHGAIFGLLVAIVATAGDLAESLIKRDLGVKDMGTLVPGHGGVMDRLDSLLPGAVVAYLMLAIAVPVVAG